MKKIILVTGGTGCVGHGIQYSIQNDKCIDEKWIFVGSKDFDLTSDQQTLELFEKFKPTHVIHLAAMVGSLYKNMDQNLCFFRTNMKINDNVLKYSSKFKVKKVLSCLSTCVFPSTITYPITEESSIVGNIHESNFGYAWSKRIVMVLNKAYNQTNTDCLFTSFIPCNIFGQYDNFKQGESHIIPTMIRRFYEAKLENKPVVVFGTGKPLRQFLYSRDLGKLIIWLLRNYQDPNPIIIAPDESYEDTISNVVNKISNVNNFKGDIIYDTTKSDGQFRRTVCNHKLKNMVNFKFTPFEQAIKETIDWYEKSVENQCDGMG